MGHEFTGTVSDIGSSITTVKIGDMIVSPFTISCGKCFYCEAGSSSRCEQSRVFGSTALDGGQAEYVRVPLADSTVMKAPEGMDEVKLCLMADIWPTGYFAAANAFKGIEANRINDSTVVVIGCGPVGLCALINALDYKPKHLLAVDGVQSRLDLAKSLGAEPWNYQTDREGLDRRVKQLTSGRGADSVIEVVGLSAALQTAFDLLRPWGNISSVGVHNGEIPWTGNQAYGKNLSIQMGRCPVRSRFSLLGWLFEIVMLMCGLIRHFPPSFGEAAAEAAFARVSQTLLLPKLQENDFCFQLHGRHDYAHEPGA
jgi:threonine dehydrogenase-like Zn-dependent dehydrogenase